MPVTLYCWRCRIEVPMLTEEEWAQVEPHFNRPMDQIKAYRAANPGSSIMDGRRFGLGQEAIRIYREISGYAETFPESLLHHRTSLVGPPCHACGKPLRTPRAKWCAYCGVYRV